MWPTVENIITASMILHVNSAERHAIVPMFSTKDLDATELSYN